MKLLTEVLKGVSLSLALAVAMQAVPAMAGSEDGRIENPRAVKGPQDLPYYDLEWARSLSLQDLNARVTEPRTIDGVQVYVVAFDAFDQPIATAKGVQRVRWRQRAVLALPVGKLRSDKALAHNVHDSPFGEPDIESSKSGTGVRVARAFGIPVMVHGWQPDVVKAIEGRSFHSTQASVMQELFDQRIENAAELPMDGRYLFNGNPLTKGDMVALTLLQRLVEKERGVQLSGIAAVGGSKEGAAHWALGAVDDRVTVLVPGGYYLHESSDFLHRAGADLNWKLPGEAGDGGRLYRQALKLTDWMATTEAGDLVARTTMEPVRWYGQIKAKHLIVYGDIGLSPGQHDGFWPFWSENSSLAKLRHPSWRYIRVYDGDGLLMREGKMSEMGLAFLPNVADVLVNDSVLPSPPAASLTKAGERRVRLEVESRFTPGTEREVIAVYAISPERGLRDGKYWKEQKAVLDRDGRWTVELPPVPDGHGLAVIAVAREKAKVGGLEFWRSASALPIEAFGVPQFASTPAPDWRE